jgi:ABC-type multidrug transport system ATPase subunit
MLFSLSTKELSKKFAYEWIFRNFSQDFQLGGVYVFVGNNGSGKSTLLKVLAGMTAPTSGKIFYTRGKMLLPVDYWFRNLSYAAPYLELIEEFSLVESIDFHTQFKKLHIEKNLFIEELGFVKSAQQKPIKYFSSGMKQKLKLAFTLFSDVPLLFLDEPTANFDKNNLIWYQEKMLSRKKETIVLLASNLVEEYDFLETKIFEMKNYK